MDGRSEHVPLQRDRPLLLNLWASWCQPCLLELAELAKHNEVLAGHVDVLALSVDRLGDDRSAETQARELLERMDFPFPTGWATDDLIDKLHLAHHTIFESQVELPIPCSVLISRQGELTAVYEGALSTKRLMDDLQQLDHKDDTRRQRSLPLEGRWAEPPMRARLLPMVWDLIQQGHLDDGLEYIQQHRSQLEFDVEYAKLLALTGYELLERGDVAEGAEQYRAAIRVDPKTTVAHLNLAAALARLNRFQEVEAQYHEALKHQPDDARIHDRLAWLLATAPEPDVRNGEEAVLWAEKAARATRFRHVLVMETLAAAYAQAGRFDEAVLTATKVLQAARATGNQALTERTQQRLQLFQRRQPYHEPPSPPTN